VTKPSGRPDDRRQATLFMGPEAARQGLVATPPPGWGPGRRLRFTDDELASVVLPPAGSYRVRVSQVRCYPDGDSPVEVEVVMDILDPARAPPTLADLFELRTQPGGRLSIKETRRLIVFLLVAGIAVSPGVPFDVQETVGKVLVAEVRPRAGAGGFPYANVARYHRADHR